MFPRDRSHRSHTVFLSSPRSVTLPVIEIPAALAEVASNEDTPSRRLSETTRMGAFFTKLKSDPVTIMLVILVGLILYKDYIKPELSGGPTVVHDAIATKLGKDYRTKLASVGSSPFKAVAKGTFDNIEELTVAQQKAASAAWADAYAPIVKELESRFGKAEDGKASVRTVQSFFDDLDYGYGN